MTTHQLDVPQPSQQSPQPPIIFYVEDHADTLLVMHRLLSTHGYDVRVARSFKEALECADKLGKLDLLIADVLLPDGNGLHLLSELRPRFPQLCGIALSGLGLAEDIENSRLAGFERHITKPVSLQALLAAISEVLSHECGSSQVDEPLRSSAARSMSS